MLTTNESATTAQAFLLFEIIAAIIFYKRFNKTTILCINKFYKKMKCIIEFSKKIVGQLHLNEKKYYLANINKFPQPRLKRSNNNLNDGIEIKKHMLTIHNLTLNFLKNPQLMEPFMIFMHGMDGFIMSNINWEKEMYHKEISFALHDTCFIGCKEILKANNRSSQCIIYDINGIEVGNNK